MNQPALSKNRNPHNRSVNFRRDDYDVSDRINLRDPEAVFSEVSKIISDFCPDGMIDKVRSAFSNVTALYRGELSGYHACDVPYHDLQHIMDVTLASTRLITSYERRQRPGNRLGPERIMMGVILALFHDCGYIRNTQEDTRLNGAEYTLTHIARGAKYLENYLPQIGLESQIGLVIRLIEYTGYETPVENIKLDDPRDKMLGYLVGSADLLAQMADRCYLEKCRDRLYPEFVLGGMTTRKDESGSEITLYQSAEELLEKTPEFYHHMVRPRLDEKFHRVAEYAADCFDGRNLYQEEIDRNLEYLELILKEKNFALLRRHLHDTPESSAFPYERIQPENT
jgi:hypothetical protein